MCVQHIYYFHQTFIVIGLSLEHLMLFIEGHTFQIVASLNSCHHISLTNAGRLTSQTH